MTSTRAETEPSVPVGALHAFFATRLAGRTQGARLRACLLAEGRQHAEPQDLLPLLSEVQHPPFPLTTDPDLNLDLEPDPDPYAPP